MKTRISAVAEPDMPGETPETPAVIGGAISVVAVYIINRRIG
jgi:hypothetical protein